MNKKVKAHVQSSYELYKLLLKTPTTKSVTFVLMWRFISRIQGCQFEEDEVTKIAELMVEYVHDNMNGCEDISAFSEYLSVVDHCRLIEEFIAKVLFIDSGWTETYKLAGWIFAGYGLILENSKHLEHR